MPSLDIAHFSPAELEAITGLTRAQQLDWRKRGFLPSVAGHATFDPPAVARVLVMKVLADLGIGPTRTMRTASACMAPIIYHALDPFDAFRRRYGASSSALGGAMLPTETLAQDARWLTTQFVLGELGIDTAQRSLDDDPAVGAEFSASAVVFWPNGDVEFDPVDWQHSPFPIDEAGNRLSKAPPVEGRLGARIEVDLRDMAYLLAVRAKRPLFTVQVGIAK